MTTSGRRCRPRFASGERVVGRTMSDGRLNHVRKTKTIARWYLRHQSVDTGADRIEKSREAFVVACAPSFGRLRPRAVRSSLTTSRVPRGEYRQRGVQFWVQSGVTRRV